MKQILIIIIAGLAMAAGGCKKYLDVNTDPNNPVDVQAPLILAPVELNISDNVYAGNAAVIIQYLVQGIAPNQPNPGLWNYQLFNNTFDGDWAVVYTTCLQNLKLLNEKAEKSGSYNYSGIAKILTAYTLAAATDIWGDIPYSQAFQGSAKFTPAYDKQEDIYKTIQSLLSTGIADINKNSTIVPSGDDYFYGGAMAKWKKLAYTLKARYFMHLTKATGYTASVQSDSALAVLANGMSSNADDLQFAYDGAAGDENSWNLAFSPVVTAVLNSTLVDSLKARNDPRLPKMVLPAASTGLYTGRKIGSATGSLDTYSYPADFYGAATASNHIVGYSEALFLKAEAVFIKSGAVAAAPVYVSAI
ncbi:MAG TPA: SusD/RagB family nutrient-binding outer membrane lipoprotein, partial [Chitinophagaceae bacterium]|nr:SusD/RagB family nutrient-binding outer membrane lipoprotein [Chitinophagaceae bacterium]